MSDHPAALCTCCARSADDLDTIDSLFGFRPDERGRLTTTPQPMCRVCRACRCTPDAPRHDR